MHKLFLDDWRIPVDCTKYMYSRHVDCNIYLEDWIIIRSYGQFVNWIKSNGIPDSISFDHDLGDVEELKDELDKELWYNVADNRDWTGMDCAKWLVEYCLDNNLKLPKYYVHSHNPCGYENIKGLLNSFSKC